MGKHRVLNTLGEAPSKNLLRPALAGHDSGCPQKMSCYRKLIKKFKTRYPEISLSIGISEMEPASDVNAEKLIKTADEKMYLAKKEKGSKIQL